MRNGEPTFRCTTCGGLHSGPPRAYTVGEPAGWEITRDPSSRRWGEIYEEQAFLHGPEGEEGWFVRGNVEIPVEDGGDLVLTVWISLSQEKFERAGELWTAQERVHEEPYFGWLSSVLPGYPSTLNLKTLVHWREPGVRPFVELEPNDHPLAVEQREGITLDRLAELAQVVLHSE